MDDYPSGASSLTRNITLVATLLGAIASLLTVLHFLGWLAPSGPQSTPADRPPASQGIGEEADAPPKGPLRVKQARQTGFTDIDWMRETEGNPSRE